MNVNVGSIGYKYTLFLYVALVLPFISIVQPAAARTLASIGVYEGEEEDSLRSAGRILLPPKDSTFRDSTFKADEVVVTGSRNEMLLKHSPVRVEVAGKDRIRETGMVGLANLLQEQTGITIVNNVRNGVQMNGLSPDYTMILVDGQPLVGRVAGVIDLNRISVGNIERVEIVKGPMSSLYGSEALGGVINIITRKPEEGLRYRAYSQYLTRGPLEFQGEVMHSSEALDLTGFLNVKHSMPFELEQDTFSMPFSGFTDGTAQVVAKWRATSELTLEANTRLFRSESRGSFIESFFGQVAANEGSIIQFDRAATIGADWRRGAHHLTFQSYYSLYSEQYNFDVEQGSGERIDDYYRSLSRTIAQYDLLWSHSHRFTFGGEFLFEDARGTRYPDEPYYTTIVGYGQWEGTPNDWLAYSVSARFDGNSLFGNSFNPKVSLLFKLDDADRFQLRTSMGTGFRAPDFRQLFVEFSNRLPGANYDLIGAARLGNELEPERSTTYDLTFNADLGELNVGKTSLGRWKADIRGYRNDLRNLIDFYFVGMNGQRAVYSYRNLSRVYTQGIEGNIETRFSLGDGSMLTLAGGYQYLDAADVEVLEAIREGRAGTVNNQTGEFVPLRREEYGGLWFRSRHTANARAAFSYPALGVSGNIRAQYVGRFGDEALDRNGLVLGNPPRRVLDRPDEYVPGYWNINAAVSKSFTLDGLRSLTFTAGANNLLNVINLQSLPGLVGRQFFVNCGVEW